MASFNNNASVSGRTALVVDDFTMEFSGGIIANDKDNGKNLKTNQDNDNNNKRKQLTFWEIVAIQASYSSAANIFQIPTMIGIWGYVLGPILFGLWFVLVYYIAAFVCDVVAASPHQRCQHYSGVGYELMGQHGRQLFRTVQLVNMLLYIPSVLVSAQEALRTIFGEDSLNGCVGYWKLIVFAILFVILQVVKNFKESSWLAFASLAMAFLQACIFAPILIASQQEEYKDNTLLSPDTGEILNKGPAQPFLYPDADWWTVMMGFIPYGFTGTFLVAETMSVAKDPTCYKKALAYSMGIMYILYMVPALCVVLLWGWNFDYLLNIDFGQGWGSIIVQLFIFVPNLLDFLLSCLVVNDSFRRRFIDRNCNDEEANANPSIGKQLLITSPTLLFSLVVATVVPNFETLIGINVSAALLPGITWMISAAWFVSMRRNKNNNDSNTMLKSSAILQTISLVVGFGLSIVWFVAFVQGFIGEDWSAKGIFCG